ncbi:MAG: biopolymer transporter ExbD [Rhodothermales bacterium]
MPLLKKKARKAAEIPTSSMADIAFLLLIFFLVTTTIDVDTGIGMVLPPKLDETEPPPVKERNMLKILVNETGLVLLEDKPSQLSLIRDEVVKHVTNFGADPNYSERPGVAVISIKTSGKTPYDSYIQVLNEVWMAYFQIWDNEARSLGYPDYATYQEALGAEADNVVRDKFPAAISIAEPDDTV